VSVGSPLHGRPRPSAGTIEQDLPNGIRTGDAVGAQACWGGYLYCGGEEREMGEIGASSMTTNINIDRKWDSKCGAMPPIEGVMLMNVNRRNVWMSLGMGILMNGALIGCGVSDTENVNGAEEGIQAGVLENGFPQVGEVVDSRGSYCTGSLISPSVVLNAAHCQGPQLTFRTGTNTGNFVDHAVDRQISHPSKDILLLHLTQPIRDIRPLDINPRVHMERRYGAAASVTIRRNQRCPGSRSCSL
jgi:hypothetical protein